MYRVWMKYQTRRLLSNVPASSRGARTRDTATSLREGGERQPRGWKPKSAAALGRYDPNRLTAWLDRYHALPSTERYSANALSMLWRSLPSDVPTVVCCNALLNACAKDNNTVLLVHIHERMMQEGIVPSVVTYNTLIKAYLGCAEAGLVEDRLARARSLVEEMRAAGLEPDARTYTPVIAFLAEHSRIHDMEEIIAEMEMKRIKKDVFVYNSILQGYANVGDTETVEKIFKSMQSGHTKPSGATYHIVMAFFSRIGSMEKVADYWNSMKSENARRPEQVEISVRSYTILLDGFGRNGNKDSMLQVWQELKSKKTIRPNTVSYGCIINHLGRMGEIEDMMHLYAELKKHRIGTSEVIYNHLLEHLGNSGHIRQAEEVFEEMKQDPRVTPNIMLYNVMLDVYAKAVLVEKAETLYQELLNNKLQPTSITFATLIEAATRACRWDSIETFLRQMEAAEVKPDAILFNNLIDAYGFMGQPDRAESVVQDLIPKHDVALDSNHITSLIEAWARNRRMDKAEEWLLRLANMPQGDRAERAARQKALSTFLSFCDPERDAQRIALAKRAFEPTPE